METLVVITQLALRLHIVGFAILAILSVLYYLNFFRKRAVNTDSKLSNIESLINRMCHNRVQSIEIGYKFVNEFQKLYENYKPYHVLVNSFNWCESIKNYKMNNILRIKDDVDPFEIIPEYKNLPLSDINCLNTMITKGLSYSYVEYTEDISNTKGETIIRDKIYNNQIKCSYMFFRYDNYNNVPIFVCILSYQDFVQIPDEELFEISNRIQKIIF